MPRPWMAPGCTVRPSQREGSPRSPDSPSVDKRFSAAPRWAAAQRAAWLQHGGWEGEVQGASPEVNSGQ